MLGRQLWSSDVIDLGILAEIVRGVFGLIARTKSLLLESLVDTESISWSNHLSHCTRCSVESHDDYCGRSPVSSIFIALDALC